MLITAAVCAALALSGCGGQPHRHASRHAGQQASQQASRPRSATQAALRTAQRTHEYPSPPPIPEATTAGAPSAVAAIRAFATAYINWSSDTVAAQLRALAQESIGQARSAMALAATGTARDYELRRGGVANRGTVEAVAPLSGGRSQYVVVTRELTTATATNVYQGLEPAWHVSIATVDQIAPGQWVMSGWQPES